MGAREGSPSLLFTDETLLFCLHVQHRSTVKVRQAQRPRHIGLGGEIVKRISRSHANFRQQHAKIDNNRMKKGRAISSAESTFCRLFQFSAQYEKESFRVVPRARRLKQHGRTETRRI